MRCGPYAMLVAFASILLACQSPALQGCPNWPNPEEQVIPVYRENPMYPVSAYRAEVEGYVEIAAVISREGRVTSATVIESLPPGVFDSSALRAYKTWRYCPLKEGAPDYPNPTTLRLSFRMP